MAHSSTPSATSSITRVHVSHGKQQKQSDKLAVEEPLEIILDFQKPDQHNRDRLTLAVTMRTPGHDEALAAGFLFSEGIIHHKSDIQDIGRDKDAPSPDNTIVVILARPLNLDPDRLQRYFFTNSSCGVCGKTSMQALEMLHRPNLMADKPKITAGMLQQLPEILRQQQQQFAVTGGVHASALFSAQGELLLLREDVGRHNAMDKLIGACLLEDKLPLLKENLVLVSGRASFELVQKALMADVSILASIGAPTSLAAQLADRHEMTLVSFLRADSFNIYSGQQRIKS